MTTDQTEERHSDAQEQAEDLRGEEAQSVVLNKDGEELPVPGNALVTVAVDGERLSVPIAEAVRGYQRQADYTRKTQALANERRALEQLKSGAEPNPDPTDDGSARRAREEADRILTAVIKGHETLHGVEETHPGVVKAMLASMILESEDPSSPFSADRVMSSATRQSERLAGLLEGLARNYAEKNPALADELARKRAHQARELAERSVGKAALPGSATPPSDEGFASVSSWDELKQLVSQKLKEEWRCTFTTETSGWRSSPSSGSPSASPTSRWSSSRRSVSA